MSRQRNVGTKAEGIGTYHPRVDSEPSLVLVLPDHVHEQLLIVGVAHLRMDKELVAGHVVGDDGQTLGEARVHPVDVDIDCGSQLELHFNWASETYVAPRASRAMSQERCCPS